MKNFFWIFLAAIAGSLITLGAYKGLGYDKQVVEVKREASAPYVLTSQGYVGGSGDMPLDFSMAAEKSTPAVVHIKSTSGFNEPQRESEETLPEPFRYFFGPETPRMNPHSYPRQSSGSGVIINSEEGYIVTNNHVIDDADQVSVTLNDGREYEATVIGTDPSTDLALIKISAENLASIPLINSDEVKVGQWVLAVGNPFNLTSTVTAGIVSAKGRNINILKDAAPIESFIQTDAAVNPGNSGGALVNLNGDLVGINTAIASPTGAYSGYSFAVPANIVSKVVEDLVTYGTVQRGFLGVSIRNIDGTLAEEEGLTVSEGAYVAGLMEDGAAEDAGIKEGDVIVEVEDRTITNVAELQESIARKRPGDKVEVKIIRDGKERSLTVELRNREGSTEIVREKETHRINALGAEFKELRKSELKDLDLDYGVKVDQLYAGRLRQHTNIREGFIITSIDRKPIKSLEDLERALAEAEGAVMIKGTYPNSNRIIYEALPLD